MKKIDQMKSIAYAYASNRECALQEAMYQIMLEFWIKIAIFQKNVLE